MTNALPDSDLKLIIQKFLELLKSSKDLSKKFSENLLDSIEADSVNVETLYWTNVYESPINRIISLKNVLVDENCIETLTDFIKSGVSSYQAIADQIFTKTGIKSTYALSSNSQPGSRLYLETAARCIRYKGNLYRFIVQLNPDENTFLSARMSYFISFVSNPLSDNSLFELSNLYKLTNDYFSALFYAFKGAYGLANYTPCSDIVANAVKDVLSFPENEFKDLWPIQKDICVLIQHFNSNEMKTLNFNFYSSFEYSIIDFIKSHVGEKVTSFTETIETKDDKLFVSQSIDTQITYIFSIVIMMLDVLRRKDSDHFRALFSLFGNVLITIVQNVKIFFSQKFHVAQIVVDKNGDSQVQTSKSSEESNYDSFSKEIFDNSSNSNYQNGNPNISNESSLEEDSCFSEEEEEQVFNIRLGYTPDRQLLEGLRELKKNRKGDIQIDSENVNDYYCFSKIIKITLDWFTFWPESISIIEEELDINLKDIFKDLIQSFPFYDQGEEEIGRFLSEDICCFGHPIFSILHKGLDFNKDFLVFPETAIEEEIYRINYIQNIVSSDVIFEPIKLKTPTSAAIKPWASKNKKSNGVSNGKRGKKYYLERKSRRNNNQRRNKPTQDSDVQAFSDKEQIDKSGTMFNVHHPQKIFSVKSYNRIHVICFYTVLYDFSLIKSMIWGKTIRITVPDAAFNMIDDMKKIDPEARKVSKFIIENCFPKFVGFRLQKREEAQALNSTKPPISSDAKLFQYIDSILQTAIYNSTNVPKNEPVVALITSIEFEHLFGSEDLLSSTSEQAINRINLLEKVKSKGIDIITKEDFIKKYSEC